MTSDLYYQNNNWTKQYALWVRNGIYPDGTTYILNFSDISQISEAKYEFEIFPMLTKWRKNELKKFLLGKILEIKNDINGGGELRYDTSLYVAKVSYQSDNWFGNC